MAKYVVIVDTTSRHGSPIVPYDVAQTALQVGNDFHAMVQESSVGASLRVIDAAVNASGTVTAASVAAGDTFTVGATTFTAVASGAAGNQFNVLGTDTLTAADIVRAVNASTVKDLVSASNVAGAVKLTWLNPGKTGNNIPLSSSNGTRLAVSGAFLAGGAGTITQWTL